MSRHRKRGVRDVLVVGSLLVLACGIPVAQVVENRARGETPVRDLFSGVALNDLLGTLNKVTVLPQAEPEAEIPASVMLQLNLKRGGRVFPVGLLMNPAGLKWPKVLAEKEYEKVRLRAQTALQEAIAQSRKGKGAAGALKSLEESSAALEAELTRVVGDVSPSEYIESKRFLIVLRSVRKALGAPKVGDTLKALGGLTGRAWTVPELVAYLNKHELTFGPALLDGAGAYVRLHEAFAAYAKRAVPVGKP